MTMLKAITPSVTYEGSRHVKVRSELGECIEKQVIKVITTSVAYNVRIIRRIGEVGA